MCLTDLREYMTQAAKTCSFLESLKVPFSTDVWMSAVRHRSEENNAYELGSVFPILGAGIGGDWIKHHLSARVLLGRQ